MQEGGVVFAHPFGPLYAVDRQPQRLVLHETQKAGSQGLHLAGVNSEIYVLDGSELDVGGEETAFEGLEQVVHVLALTGVVVAVFVLVEDAQEVVGQHLENGVGGRVLDTSHVLSQRHQLLHLSLDGGTGRREEGPGEGIDLFVLCLVRGTKAVP